MPEWMNNKWKIASTRPADLLHHILQDRPERCGLLKLSIAHGALHRLSRIAHLSQAGVVQQRLQGRAQTHRATAPQVNKAEHRHTELQHHS